MTTTPCGTWTLASLPLASVDCHCFAAREGEVNVRAPAKFCSARSCKGEGVHGLSPGIDCEGLLVSLSRFICLELKAGGTLGGRSRTRLTLVAPPVENVKLSVIIVTIV